jgi:hypothetical protein
MKRALFAGQGLSDASRRLSLPDASSMNFASGWSP